MLKCQLYIVHHGSHYTLIYFKLMIYSWYGYTSFFPYLFLLWYGFISSYPKIHLAVNLFAPAPFQAILEFSAVSHSSCKTLKPIKPSKKQQLGLKTQQH